MTAKDKSALKAAKQIREYCNSIPGCKWCIFYKNGCLLNDPDHKPETWEIEKIKEV